MYNFILSLLGGFAFASVCTSFVGFFVKKFSSILSAIIAIPLFLFLFYHGVELSSRQLFISDNHGTGGEVLLEASPMRVPSGIDHLVYCKQFTDKQGQTLPGVTTLAGINYCGKYYLGLRSFGMGIPFIKQSDGKTAYWASAFATIIRQ